jgi:hypothetical protein
MHEHHDHDDQDETPPEFHLNYPNVEDGRVLGTTNRGRRRYVTDVVVVGSGAGGAPAAALLRDAGFDVILLEEGGLHRTESFRTDPISSLQHLYRDAGTSSIMGRPPILFAEGKCVGGSTTVNGGMTRRRWRRTSRRPSRSCTSSTRTRTRSAATMPSSWPAPASSAGVSRTIRATCTAAWA